MNDDLISRKDLLGTERLLMTDIVAKNPTAKYILEQVLFDIKNAPTAFDKERVIEDLNDWMIDAEKWAAKYDEVGDTDNMDLQDMAARCYKNAIEIVEKGGIE